jgi:hypothetical protein
MKKFPRFIEWIDLKEQNEKSSCKINNKKIKSPGIRDGQKDLSADYEGHIAHNGTVKPFKIKKGK